MEQRSLNEALADRLLLLYLVNRVRQKGYNILGPIKLQKLIYKTEETLCKKKIKGLTYTFIRWKHGPFSQEIYSDVDDLKECGFLITEDEASTSEKGRRMASIAEKLLDPETKDTIDRVINEFGPLNGKQLKAVMYSYPVFGEMRTIREAKEGELLLSKLNEVNGKDSLKLDEDFLETLSVLFNPSACNSIKKSLAAMKTEEAKPFIPVT